MNTGERKGAYKISVQEIDKKFFMKHTRYLA